MMIAPNSRAHKGEKKRGEEEGNADYGGNGATCCSLDVANGLGLTAETHQENIKTDFYVIISHI